MRYGKIGEFTKFDAATGYAYGWAIVCTKAGKPYVDLQGDHIPESAMLEAAADFMASSRVGKDMHRGDQVGDVPFAFPVTKDNREGLGIAGDMTGLMIAYKPSDPALVEMLKSGERAGFSIGGWLGDADIVEEVGKASVVRKSDKWRKVYAKRATSGVLDKAVRVFRTFKIGEISTVDVPAQEPAKITLYKSAHGLKAKPEIFVVRKDALLTSITDGHQHVVDLDDVDDDGVGCTSFASIDGQDYGHTHAFLKDPQTGEYVVSANEGHDHTIDPKDVRAATATPPPGAPVAGADLIEMRAPNIARASQLTKAAHDMLTNPQSTHSVDRMDKDALIAELKKKLADAEAFSLLGDVHKSHALTLPDDARGAFVKMSAADRENIVLAKRGSLLYKSERLGAEFYANDPAGSAMARMARDADDAFAMLAKSNAERDEAKFSKAAADTIPNFPGDAATHAAIMKALETISDATVKAAAITACKGASGAIVMDARFRGVSPVHKGNGNESPTLGEAETELRTAVEAFQKANNLTSYEVAFSQATQRDQKTREAYDKVQNERAIAKRAGNSQPRN